MLRASIALCAFVIACSSSPDPHDGGADATTDGTSNDATASDSPADVAQDDSGVTDCIALINQYRAQVSAPPIARKLDQEACATSQATKGAADLADSGTTTFHKYFGQCSEKYQNECWYSQDDVAAVIAWCMAAFYAEGPPDSGINHYSVMTDPKSQMVACGLAHLPTGGYWMTNDYY